MNKWLLLLIVIGLGVFGWLDRDKIRTLIIGEGYGHYLPGKLAPGTPNPAMESVKQAKATYPALGIANSPLNQRFVALYNSKKQDDPDFLVKEDWPMLLAQQAATDLGVGAIPTPPPLGNPAQLQSSTLDNRSIRPVATVSPMVQLPGFSGTALDQRPAGKR